MISGLCFGFVLLILWLCHRMEIDYFDPLVLYLATQFGGLGVAYLKLSPAMTDWRPLTWVVFLGSAGMFCLGSFLARQFRPKTVTANPEFHSQVVAGILVLFVAWAMVGFLAGSLRAGIPLFSDDQDRAKKAFDGVRFSIAFGLQNTLMIYGLAVALVVSPWRTMRWIGWIGFLLGLAAMLLLGVRNSLLFALFVLAYAWSVQIRRIGFRKLALYSVGFLFLFVMIAMLRIGMGVDYSWVMDLPKEELKRFGEGILSPIYEYLANNYWNLDHAISQAEGVSGHSRTYGFAMMEGVFDLPGIARKMQRAFGWDSFMNETSRKVYYLNTVGYQWTIFKDFGSWGVAVFAFLWGWWTTWLHLQALASRNALLSTFSGAVQFSVFFGFFAWYFLLPSYVYVVVALGILMMIPPFKAERLATN